MRINYRYFHAASTLATARLIMLSRYLSRAFSARSFPNHNQYIDGRNLFQEVVTHWQILHQVTHLCRLLPQLRIRIQTPVFQDKKWGKIQLKNKSSLVVFKNQNTEIFFFLKIYGLPVTNYLDTKATCRHKKN